MCFLNTIYNLILLETYEPSYKYLKQPCAIGMSGTEHTRPPPFDFKLIPGDFTDPKCIRSTLLC